jgi:hypothetical protein
MDGYNTRLNRPEHLVVSKDFEPTEDLSGPVTPGAPGSSMTAGILVLL